MRVLARGEAGLVPRYRTELRSYETEPAPVWTAALRSNTSAWSTTMFVAQVGRSRGSV
jgi:hypothetical protein